MKRTFFIAVIAIFVALMLSSCADMGTMEIFNNRGVVINPSESGGCSGAEGSSAEKHSVWIRILIGKDIFSITPHKEVTDAAVEATCTQTGLTEGKHCSECNTIIVAQEIVPKKPHVEKIIPAIPATCTADGTTEGKYCVLCGEVLVEQAVVAAVGHIYDDENDLICNVCEYVREAVGDEMCAHADFEIIVGKAATCVETGLTEGKRCLDCGEIIVAQNVIPLVPHIEGEWIIDKAATSTEDGKRHQICQTCGETISEETIPKVGYVEYSVNSDGVTCTVTGAGDFLGTDLYIPEYLDEYKVTDIGEEAFAENTQLLYIHIPDTVTSIGRRAFFGCTGITEIEIPASVTSIGNQIFYKASNLATVYYYSTYRSTSNPFLHLSHIKKVVFGGEYIPAYILDGCTNIQEIVIMDSVREIRIAAFQGCNNLTGVFYCGTPEQWADIVIFSKDPEFISVAKYYYSETQPADTGYQYWHYVNGVPTLW